MRHENLQAYAELWIDAKPSDEPISPTHVLMAIEIEELGHFEIEIWSISNRIKLDLYCPPKIVDSFKPLTTIFAKYILESSFKLDSISINPLDQARSLLDVFMHLSDTQMGLDIYA